MLSVTIPLKMLMTKTKGSLVLLFLCRNTFTPAGFLLSLFHSCTVFWDTELRPNGTVGVYWINISLDRKKKKRAIPSAYTQKSLYCYASHLLTWPQW